MQIIIYGLGEKGQEFIRDIQEILTETEIVAVTDTYVRQLEGQTAYELPYIEPNQIWKYRFDYIVVTPEKFFGEIRNQLCSWGICENKIKTVKEFEEKVSDTYCELCGDHPGVWRYIGENYDIFRKKNIMGASRRRGRCSVCGSSDRERYVYHIIKNYTGLFDGKKHTVLHFAPERMLSKKIRNACKESYLTADLLPERGDIIADITCLPFADNRFEYIICNHVMEHVGDEYKAFSEVRRCLIPGGLLILTVPICWDEKTYEDKGITSQEERVKYYGQEDHVRLYGNDIVKRIEGFGFHVELYRCDEIMDKRERNRLGFIPMDAVLLCRR